MTSPLLRWALRSTSAALLTQGRFSWSQTRPAAKTACPDADQTSWAKSCYFVPSRSLATAAEAATKSPDSIRVLYKGRWMLPFHILVRLKVLQLTGFAALAIPVNAWLSSGTVDLKVLTSSLFVMVGSAVASTSLWYYSRRYVGELSLKGKQQERVRFSVMDFWGNRTEEEYSIDSVVPPLRGLSPEEQSRWIQERFFVPVDVIGGRQYFISVKHGHILEKELLLKLLDGRHLQDRA